MKRKIVKILVCALLITGFFTIFGTPILNAEDPPIGNWYIEGYGTYFEITNSNYLNITLSSSEYVYVYLSSLPCFVAYIIESNNSINSTDITLTGFEPNKTYYFYENDNLTHNITTDTFGSYSYIHNFSDIHYVYTIREILDVSTEYDESYVEGYGTYFEITNSDYLNVTLISSENVYVILSSELYSIEYFIESNCSANFTEIILSGLEASRTYYLYEDNSEKGIFTTNESGSYTYTQDITNRHHVYTLEVQSTIYILPDGTVYPATAPISRNGNVYTLTGNIYETIKIGKSGITLDGNGYTIQNMNTVDRFGIDFWYVSYITIKNVIVDGFYDSINFGDCDNVVITNCTISNSDHIAIRSHWIGLVSINNCTISNCGTGVYSHVVTGPSCMNIVDCSMTSLTGDGIYLRGNPSFLIKDNTISNFAYHGIRVSGGFYGNITDNIISSAYFEGCGILVDDYSFRNINLTLKNNILSNLHTGIRNNYMKYVNMINNSIYRSWYGIHLWEPTHNFISQNTIKVGGYGFNIARGSQYNNISFNDISKFNYGIYTSRFNPTKNIIYGNNIFSNKYYGIFMDDSAHDGNTVSYNNISNNGDGIFIFKTNNVKLICNRISDNTGFGIKLYWCRLTIINNNTIENNGGTGIYLYTGRTYDNTIWHNNIINNSVQAYADYPSWNYWHHPDLLEGNYWSDYCGFDDGSGTGKHAIAGDGIGDTNIPHPATHYDFYPFLDIVSLCSYECTTCNEAPIADAGGPYSSDEGSIVIFNASNSVDPDDDPLEYRWDFNNDGIWDTNYSTDPTASYTWNDDCIGIVTVEVSDGDLTNTATTTVTVNNVAPTADAGCDHIGDEPSTFIFTGSHSDPGTQDTHTYEWDYDYDGITFNIDDTGTTVTNTWNDDFDGTIALRVTDDDGGWHIDTCTVIVNNVAPTITSFTGQIDPVNINDPVEVDGIFTDPGTLDIHSANIDWDDGNITLATVDEANGCGTIEGLHYYGQPGVYTVKLTVVDDDSGSDTTTLIHYIVIYDPNGGFVTGGGWINSPPGAYTPDPTLTGKANFGFVSKYKNGQQTPSGNTEFQFKTGDLNFHSKDYDWLVIAGAKAMYKGTGTINNAGNYGFMLSAIDEDLTPSTDVDMFRIKIWDKDNNDEVIYDNQLGDDEDADPTTEIGGGQIKIHKG